MSAVSVVTRILYGQDGQDQAMKELMELLFGRKDDGLK